ncbi:YfhD family protein [Paenibacillus sp. J2TS4]|uniref:YfhD family protein n=1 Tax=Paenibacillus sp. J2TS4 TaxID=2807194 RepID=UPI001B2C5E8E|nr:YfhD family protein [Paenibacillus sp. J2TS4]GIP35853.1 hypothetical protein J2TS4_50630 [Paenibacillus sp. J2TS4]
MHNSGKERKEKNENRSRELPVTKNEDVEFSREWADEDDLEALARAEAADERAGS